MTRKRPPVAAPSAEVTAAFVKLFEGVFYYLMIGIVRAREKEERFLRFRGELVRLTKAGLRARARPAAEYYVAHANPSTENLPADKIQKLKEAAIEHALQARAR